MFWREFISKIFIFSSVKIKQNVVHMVMKLNYWTIIHRLEYNTILQVNTVGWERQRSKAENLKKIEPLINYLLTRMNQHVYLEKLFKWDVVCFKSCIIYLITMVRNLSENTNEFKHIKNIKCKCCKKCKRFCTWKFSKRSLLSWASITLFLF
jgi:hypothetical protein